jgi:polysaccharide export outer membrane protein
VRALSLALLLVGCSGTGPYVWVNDLREPAAREGDYQLVAGDTLSIQVFAAAKREDNLSTRERVRPDGKITMSLVGEIDAAGKRPQTLAAELEGRLAKYLESPSVNIVIEESRGISVAVVGEVTRSGTYPLERGSGVLTALASAGGLTEYADKDRIFVVRKSPPRRVRFTYELLTHGEARAQGFTLQNGDIVVVE